MTARERTRIYWRLPLLQRWQGWRPSSAPTHFICEWGVRGNRRRAIPQRVADLDGSADCASACVAGDCGLWVLVGVVEEDGVRVQHRVLLLKLGLHRARR